MASPDDYQPSNQNGCPCPLCAHPLTFSALRSANVSRCETSFHPLKEWNPLEWAGAMCGEAGEAANLAKKIKRGDFKTPDELEAARRALADELGDVIAYVDLLAASLNIDLGRAVATKFNAVSDRVGSSITLGSL